jgi:CheY-like chemotaxis protein
MNILYIEDEPNDANLVALFVQSTPHQLTVVNTLAEGIRAINQQPQLVLVDVLLSNSRDGFQFVKAARQQGYAMPMVAVTGLSTPQDVEQCYQVGFDRVLTKPFTIDQLADLIDAYALG